jgi:hypothetical protein
MYLAHFMHLAMVVLTVAAVHGFARRLTGSASAATIASVAAATVPWLAQLGSIAYNEGGLLLFGTLAFGWAFDAVVTPARRPGRFPVAGLLAGFACGSKLTAVPEVLMAVGAISAFAVLLTGRRRAISTLPPLPSGEGRGEGGRGDNALGSPHDPTPTPPHPNPLPEGEGTGGVSLGLRLGGVALFL